MSDQADRVSDIDLSDQIAQAHSKAHAERQEQAYNGIATGLLAQLSDIAAELLPLVHSAVVDDYPSMLDDAFAFQLFQASALTATTVECMSQLMQGGDERVIRDFLGLSVVQAFVFASLLELDLPSAIENAFNHVASSALER